MSLPKAIIAAFISFVHLLTLPFTKVPSVTFSSPPFFLHSSSLMPTPAPVQVALAGDVLLARTVAQVAKQQNSLFYPFAQVAPLLQSPDITFFNLESPILSRPGEVPVNSTVFHIDPEFAPILAKSGIDVVSLANNHLPDQGEAGIKNTIEALTAQGIKTVGAGTFSESHQLQTFKVRGQTIGFLAYTDPSLVPQSYLATSTRLGTAAMALNQIHQDITSAITQTDWLIVSFHSGTEYSHQPTPKQIEFAHAAIDAGANIVVSHHPHVLQPIEEYKNGIIFYSLGNFIFDQMFSLATRQSAIVTLELEKDKIAQIKITPLLIDNYSQPRPANPQESAPILNQLNFPTNNPTFSVRYQ